MDDFIPMILDLLFWLFIIDFDKKGQAAAKILLWTVLIALGGAFVLTI